MLTPGPFSLPMTARQAFALEAILKSLPGRMEPRRLSLAQSVPEVDSRSDVSWITTEAPDRQGDIVLASGMDDSHFRLNPIVTLNHDYARPPVGRSLWRKPVREGSIVGIQAKTYYPPRPKAWSEGPWLPDLAHGLLQAGLLNAKSIGFLPLKMRSPSSDEVRQNPRLAHVRHIVERWLLLEYACCFLPVQPFATVVRDSVAGGQNAFSATTQSSGELALHAPTATESRATGALQLRSPIATNFASSCTKAASDFHSDICTPQTALQSQLLSFLHSVSFASLFHERLQRTYQKHLGRV